MGVEIRIDGHRGVFTLDVHGNLQRPPVPMPIPGAGLRNADRSLAALLHLASLPAGIVADRAGGAAVTSEAGGMVAR